MDYCNQPVLHRQTSLPPDLESSSSSSGDRSVCVSAPYYLHAEDCGADPLGFHSTTRKTSIRNLWKKIMRKNKRMQQTPCKSASVNCVLYHPTSYVQNFDEGEAMVQPENLHRSFSARFVDPASTPGETVLQRVLTERQREQTDRWF